MIVARDAGDIDTGGIDTGAWDGPGSWEARGTIDGGAGAMDAAGVDAGALWAAGDAGWMTSVRVMTAVVEAGGSGASNRSPAPLTFERIAFTAWP
jgi:hypothetical protein